MPFIPIVLPAEELRPGLDEIRTEFRVPGRFPPAVEAAAASAARDQASVTTIGGRSDERELPLFTIDPPGSRDLDQAFSAERLTRGYRVRYAIADMAAFVSPDDPVDGEAWHRGQTVYMPDGKAPLHPTVLSEDVASLLPDSDRPCLLWTVDLGADGGIVRSRLERSVVRSRQAITYADAQRALDNGTADEQVELLREVGRLREQAQIDRGGISLNLPTRELVRTPKGYAFQYHPAFAIERWNAQISLLVGECAAATMVEAAVGVLRTLPPIEERRVAKLRRVAKALDIDWREGVPLSDVVRAHDGSTPESAAFLTQVTHEMRGAGYAVLSSGTEPVPVHAGLGIHYGHVTAPLRRLVDRYANEVLVALYGGKRPPDWAVAALSRLPEAMAEADHRGDWVEGAVLNLAESLVLAPRVKEKLTASVIDKDEERVTILVRDPPVIAKMAAAGFALGDRIAVRVTSADPSKRKVAFEAV